MNESKFRRLIYFMRLAVGNWRVFINRLWMQRDKSIYSIMKCARRLIRWQAN